MKKLIMFFAGFALIVLMFAALFLTGAIYDAGEKMVVEPYFFQINNQSARRPGAPESAEALGNTAVREMLIKKYVVDYFYANPDAEDAARRIAGKSVLRRMSTREVFDKWVQTEGAVIQDIAKDKGLRMVHVFDEIYKLDDNSDYWIVEYELLTWPVPNDLAAAPQKTRGRVFLNIIEQAGLRRDLGMTVGEYLESGGDPAAVFRFLVKDVVVQ